MIIEVMVLQKKNYFNYQNKMNLTDILHELVNEPQNEDLSKWFGKGKTGSSSGGGWDRYGSDGQKLGKCGGGKKGDAYAACLSKEKAKKLGPKGRAFVRRKREPKESW